MSRLKVGNIVLIVNSGQTYSDYTDWFELNGIAANIKARHAVKKHRPNYAEGTIVAVGLHDPRHGDSTQDSNYIYGVEYKNKVYIMHSAGLELIADSAKDLEALPDFKPATLSFEDLMKGVK